MDEHRILFYEYVEDIAERRGPYREAHLEGIREARGRGQVVMAGALGAPPHAAAIVFVDTDQDEIEAFARADPYTRAGLVESWRIERWALV